LEMHTLQKEPSRAAECFEEAGAVTCGE